MSASNEGDNETTQGLYDKLDASIEHIVTEFLREHPTFPLGQIITIAVSALLSESLALVDTLYSNTPKSVLIIQETLSQVAIMISEHEQSGDPPNAV